MSKIERDILALRTGKDKKKFSEIAKIINTIHGTSYQVESVRRMLYEYQGVQALKTETINRQEYGIEVPLNIENARVLIIPDVHLPFIVDGGLEFLGNTMYKYRLNKVVCIGDILDQCAISFWDSDPNGLSAENELRMAMMQINAMAEVFPDMDICIGNHDDRHLKVAQKAGIPARYIRGFNEILENGSGADLKGWNWNYSYLLNEETIIEHGVHAGLKATYDRAVMTGMNVIQGHTHSYAGVQYINDGRKSRWSMNVGCLINHSAYAFKYSVAHKMKPTLACGVYFDGIPMVVPFNG